MRSLCSQRVRGKKHSSHNLAQAVAVSSGSDQALYNLNMPVALSFQFRSLFHRDDTLGIPTDDLIFDHVAKDNQSIARILVCHVAGWEGATTELNVGKILLVEIIAWKMPLLQIQHDISERKRAM